MVVCVVQERVELGALGWISLRASPRGRHWERPSHFHTCRLCIPHTSHDPTALPTMGRYDLRPLRVHTHATALLSASRLAVAPPWLPILQTVPPAERLTRPPMQRSQRPSAKKQRTKSSRLFKPVRLQYEEDRLRWEYFNDYPWELARPRVVLENDGRDRERWDWGVPLDHALLRPRSGSVSEEGVDLCEEWDRVAERQAGRPVDGEAFVYSLLRYTWRGA